jgi:hypothetical protein
MQGHRLLSALYLFFFGAHGLLLVAIPVLRYAFTQVLAILGAALHFLLVGTYFLQAGSAVSKNVEKSWKFLSFAGGTKVEI